jgi:hypothetical protein
METTEIVENKASVAGSSVALSEEATKTNSSVWVCCNCTVESGGGTGYGTPTGYSTRE